MRLRLGIDVDEVLANMHAPWLEWINVTFGTSFDPTAGFKSWNFWQEPEFAHIGKAVYGFLGPDAYTHDIITPFAGVREVLHHLRSRAHLAFVTSCQNHTEDAKRAWMIRHGLLEEWTDQFIPTHDKSEAPVHVLVDDGYHNVTSFKNGIPILVTRPHNVNEQWDGLRINHLSELIPHFN